MDEYIAYMWSHPPRCAAGCRPAPAELVEAVQNELGPMTTVFEIGAGQPLPIWGSPAPEAQPGMRVGPILVGSSDPATAAFAFDEHRDGYDGEFGHLGPPPERRLEPFACPSCGALQFSAVVGFQYTGDDEELDDPDLIARKQDFFSWFRLLGVCDRCGTQSVIADIQCA